MPLFHLPLLKANLFPVPDVAAGNVAALDRCSASVVGDAIVVAVSDAVDVVFYANFVVVEAVVVVVVLGGVHGHGGGDHAAGADHAVGHTSAVHFLAFGGDVALGVAVDVPVDVFF